MAEEHAWSAEVQSVLFPQPVPQPDQDAGIVAQDGMSAGQKVTLTGR
jgi:hypothetical protein